MTPQERELLTQLTQRINQTHLQEKDPDAQNLLGRELGANSDALYILAQTVLVQDMALQQARTQVNQLQQQVEEARRQTQQQPAAQHSTSFLGRLLGERDEPQAPPPPPSQQQWRQPSQPPFQPVQYAPQTPPPYGAPQYSQTGNAPGYASGYAVPAGQPSFLRGAMQTAAGVAAGALAFEGIESLLHGFGHGGGMGMGGFGMGSGMGGGFGRPIEETVVNNYYDQPGPHNSGENRFDQGDNLRGFDNSGDTATHNFAGAAAFDNPADHDSVQTSDPGQGSDYAELSGDQLENGGLHDDSLTDSRSLTDVGSLEDGGSDLSDSGLDDSSGFDSGGFDGGNFDSGTDNGF